MEIEITILIMSLQLLHVLALPWEEIFAPAGADKCKSVIYESVRLKKA